MTTFILAATLSLAGTQQKADATLDEKVASARDKAIDFIKKQQKEGGHWEGVVLNLLDMEGGCSALATLALLEAGVPAKDPAVAKAVEYLVKLEPKKTYVVSLQTQVLARADPKKHAKQIQKNADWLIEKAVRKGGKLVGWSYPGHNLADNSNTHFAVVALHYAAQTGAKLDAKALGRDPRLLCSNSVARRLGLLQRPGSLWRSEIPEHDDLRADRSDPRREERHECEAI